MLPIVLRLVVVLLVSSLGACQQQVESPRRAGPAQGSQADEDDRATSSSTVTTPSAEHAGTERAAPTLRKLTEPCDKACEDQWSLTSASCDKACRDLWGIDAGLDARSIPRGEGREGWTQCVIDCARRSLLGL